jgi:hypothetical protein
MHRDHSLAEPAQHGGEALGRGGLREGHEEMLVWMTLSGQGN